MHLSRVSKIHGYVAESWNLTWTVVAKEDHSGTKRKTQHVTFIWCMRQNYWTFCSDGNVCQTTATLNTTWETQKSQEGIILCACFHWDKPNRSLSRMALMGINLENKEAGDAYLNRSSSFPCNPHISKQIKSILFWKPWGSHDYLFAVNEHAWCE